MNKISFTIFLKFMYFSEKKAVVVITGKWKLRFHAALHDT